MAELPASDPTAAALSRPPVCQDAAAFTGWIEATFAQILHDPSPDDLDRVMLRISQEYILRRRGIRVHRRQICLLDVFHQWMDRLWEQQRSLCPTRIYQPPPSPTDAPGAPLPALYIGQHEQDNERAG